VKFTRITIDPQQMGGVPCIRKLRIPVNIVVSMVTEGMTELEILTAYPDLEATDVTESLLYNSLQKMKGYSIHEIIAEIDLVKNIDSAVDYGNLELLVDLYFDRDQTEEFLDVLFRLYERFPNDEGEHIFWSILHGIEHYPSSDRLAVKSVLNNPSDFPLMMVNRMINAGIEKVDGVDLMELLQRVATNDIYLPKIRENANNFLDYQRNKLRGGHSPPSEI
jgi:uncharacterized protein (DUF433 family)